MRWLFPEWDARKRKQEEQRAKRLEREARGATGELDLGLPRMRLCTSCHGLGCRRCHNTGAIEEDTDG